MGLIDKVSEEVKRSMKAQDKDRTSALRMILSELKYAKAAIPKEQELSAEAEIKAVTTYRNRLEKSISEFPEEEQKAKIRAEIAIADAFLPKKAAAADVEKAVDEILRDAKDRNFGVLMKQLMAQFGEMADGKVISQILKQKLGT